MYSRAFWVASWSTPAKTVTKFVGFFSEAATASFTPGLAVLAEQPQTELINNKVVPGCAIVFSTSAAELNSLKPPSTISIRIGCTKCSGYIFFYF